MTLVNGTRSYVTDAAIDAVYTWVDDSRPGFADELAAALEAHRRETGEAPAERARSPNRFRDLGLLRYSLRSLWRYAPWIDKVYLVTAGERPPWLDADHPAIRLVRHAEIFPSPAKLPTFNSLAIEACLHRVSGLSDRFLYLNDDCFLTKELRTDYFIDADGNPRFILEKFPMGFDLTDPEPVGAISAYCRWLLDLRFGHRAERREVPHEPVLMDCSTLEAMEREWPQAIARTRRNRFRTRREFAIVRMYRHYCLEQARLRANGAPIEIRPAEAGFVRFGAPVDLAEQFAVVQRADPAFLCINDETGEDAPFRADRAARDSAVLQAFLDQSFPQAAPWELPEGAATGRPPSAPSLPPPSLRGA
jgi:Stealth protein CR2, conserved region 2/Stealth protein CR3, conserved region 3/Stealth protein CR4, conserved region 4